MKTKKQQLNVYQNLDGTNHKKHHGKITIHPFLKDYTINENDNEFPVCVMSYKYNKKKSRFLSDIIKFDMELDRDYFIFIYKEEKDLYYEFEKYEKIKLVFLPNSYLRTLVDKRNFIIDWVKEKNYTNYWMVEDDIYDYRLCYQVEGQTKNFKFKIDYNLLFNIWEHIIKKYNLHFTGIYNEICFTYTNLMQDIVNPNSNIFQIVHHNSSSTKRYDETSGWETSDMTLQILFDETEENKRPTRINLFRYTNPLLFKTIHTTTNLDTLKEDAKTKTNQFIKKWGEYVAYRKQNKHGYWTAKPNMIKLRNCIKKGYDLKYFKETGKYKLK